MLSIIGSRRRIIFIPAKLSDNKILEERDPGYRATLEKRVSRNKTRPIGWRLERVCRTGVQNMARRKTYHPANRDTGHLGKVESNRLGYGQTVLLSLACTEPGQFQDLCVSRSVRPGAYRHSASAPDQREHAEGETLT